MKHNQSVCACVWREAGRLHTFSLVPMSGLPPGTWLSPGGCCCCCCLCEMKLEGEWVGFAEGRGMNRRKTTDLQEKCKLFQNGEKWAYFWTDVSDWSGGDYKKIKNKNIKEEFHHLPVEMSGSALKVPSMLSCLSSCRGRSTLRLWAAPDFSEWSTKLQMLSTRWPSRWTSQTL